MIRILTDSTADFFHGGRRRVGRGRGTAHRQLRRRPLSGWDRPAPWSVFTTCWQRPINCPPPASPARSCFFPHFLAAKAAGDTVICVLLSAALSGTCQSAEIAKEEAEYDNIYIVDSRSATLGLQLLVRRAVQRVAEGFSAMDIVADLETARTHLRLYAVVDTLKYLHKGGRLSGAVAIAGGLLGIKPVLSLDARGKLGMVDKARGMPGAYVAIFKGIDRCGGIDEAWPVVVGYSGSPKGVGPFACYVTQNLHLQKADGAGHRYCDRHPCGAGACGIAFFANEPFPGETE